MLQKSRSRPFVLEFKENMDALPGKKGRLPSYVVMARGISLREWTRTQPPDVTVYWLLHDVCTQLAALHAGGFVHRDVRPANVMWLPVRLPLHSPSPSASCRFDGHEL